MFLSIRRPSVLGPVVVLVWAFLFLSASASAKPGYIPLTSFGPPGGFAGPVGLGVDNSSGLYKGDVYVTDQGNDLVDDFSAEGALLAQASVPGVRLEQLSVDDYAGAQEGDVYVVGGSNGVVYRFTPGLKSREEFITGLSEPSDVVVDQAGNVLVSEQDAKKVLEFNAAGEPVDASGAVVGVGGNTVVEGQNLPHPIVAVAVEASGLGLYVTTEGPTYKYTLSAGIYATEGEPIDSNYENSGGITISPSGYVDIDQNGRDSRQVLEYESSGALVTTAGEGSLSFDAFGLGVDGESGKLYVADSGVNAVVVFEAGDLPKAPTTEPYSQLNGSSVMFNGTLATGTTSYHFSYQVGPNCDGGEGEGGKITPSVAVSGPQQVHAEVQELAPFTRYSFCLVATSKYGSTVGSNISLETGQVQPKITNVSLSIGTEAATLTAQINPEGIISTYYVEYGTTISYGLKTAEMEVGRGEDPVVVTTALTGLQPSTTYHYRVVAVNEAGSTDSPGTTFMTYAQTAGLPDGRVYEMVTPPENEDANVYAPYPATPGMTGTGFPFQASSNGDAVVYAADPTTGGNGINGTALGNQYMASRSPQGGWRQVNLDPLGDESARYQAFSNSLSTGIFTSSEQMSGGYRALYERASVDGVIGSLFSAVPADRENEGTGLGLAEFNIIYGGASADFSHVLFEANDDLLSGEGALEKELNSIVKAEVEQIVPLEKEYVKLHRELLKLEETEGYSGTGTQAKRVEVNATEASVEALRNIDDRYELYMSTGGTLNLVNVLPEGVVAPGATFGGHNPVSQDGSRVFWTDSAAGPDQGRVFVREDGVRTAPVSIGSARFWTATPDGAYAYYTEGGVLWRFDVGSQARVEMTGASSGVKEVIGVNETGEDGAYVYFISHDALSGLENDAKQIPVAGEKNLYVDETDSEHPGQQRTVFIGTLSYEDVASQAIATPSGNALTFTSTENLTGAPYQNEGSQEAYIFDAQDESLFCASCRAQASGGSQARISEDGDQVFFNSEAPLVWRDIDGAMDVYEWERDGSGECHEVAGCVYLISGGREEPAELIGSSASGNDVFFVTRQRLSALDGNENVDLYDARVGGVEAVSPPVCLGTACQGVPSPPPVFATPASVTFDGVGNFIASSASSKSVVKAKAKVLTRAQKLVRALKQCRSQRAKGKRSRCEARARRRYGKAVKVKSSGISVSRGRK